MFKKLGNLDNVFILEGNSFQEYIDSRIKFCDYLKANNKKLEREMTIKSIVIVKDKRV